MKALDSVVFATKAVPLYYMLDTSLFANVMENVVNGLFLKRFTCSFSPSTDSSLWFSS